MGQTDRQNNSVDILPPLQSLTYYYYYYYYSLWLLFNWSFFLEVTPGYAGYSTGLSPLPEKNLWGLLGAIFFYCHSCQPTRVSQH